MSILCSYILYLTKTKCVRKVQSKKGCSGQRLYQNFMRTKGRRSSAYENLVCTKYSGFTVCLGLQVLCHSLIEMHDIAHGATFAFSFSRRRIRVRVLNAERKISCCVQDDFTRFFKFSSVKETIRKFHSCRKLKNWPLLLVRKRSKLRANIQDEISI